MSDEKKTENVVLENLQVLATPDGFQRYMLGTKKNGQPRAVYDVVKDYTKPKKKKNKKKKKKNKDLDSTYAVYLHAKKAKKKKKKKKRAEHWHI